MFNFEDDFIIENNGISWLIWIQLVVIFLIFALYFLTIFAFDSSEFNTTIASSSSSSSTSQFVSDNSLNDNKNKNEILPNHHNFNILSNRSRNSQSVAGGDEQSIKREIETSTSRRITQVGDGTIEGESSQETLLDLHPCSYFRRARSVFLRCLGLDSSSGNSVSDERKRKESRKAKES